MSVGADTIEKAVPITIQSVDKGSLTENELSLIENGNPEFTVNNDKVNVKLVYDHTKTTPVLPNTGINPTFMLLSAGIVLLIGGCILIKQGKHKNMLLAVGTFGLLSLAVASSASVFANSSTLIEDVVMNAERGDAFKYPPTKIANYDYKGYIVVGTDVDVKEEGLVTVRFVDDENKDIQPSKTLTGFVGKAYTIGKQDISGYTLHKVTGSLVGIFTKNNQNVTLHYSKNIDTEGTVYVKYEDTDGNKLADSVILNGKVGQEYVVDRRNIEGYTFKEILGESSKKFKVTPQSITLIYEKKPVLTGSIIVNYEDQSGNIIADTETLTGPIGESYVLNKKNIEGYTFKEVLGETSGKFESNEQTITVLYTKNVAVEQRVNIKFIKEDGTPYSMMDLNMFNETPVSFDNYYFKVLNPFTQTSQNYHYGVPFEMITHVITEESNPVIPSEIPVNLYYTNFEGIEIESVATSAANGYLGNRVIGRVGFSGAKGIRVDSLTITDPVTGEITYTYKVMYTILVANY